MARPDALRSRPARVCGQHSSRAVYVDTGREWTLRVSLAQGPPVAVGPDGAGLAFALETPAPNPAHGRTTLAFAIPVASEGSLTLFDVGGRLVRVLARGPFAPGRHTMTLDGRDSGGRHLAPGLYFVRLSAGFQPRVQRLVVMP